MTDHRLDRRTSSQVTLDRVGDAGFLARDVNPELVFWRSVMAPIALVGDEPIDGRADLMLDIGDDAFQRVSVVGISRKRLRVRNELAAPGNG